MSIKNESYVVPMYGTCMLPNNIQELKLLIAKCCTEITALEKEFFAKEYKDDLNMNEEKSNEEYSNECIPITEDVRTFDFTKLANSHKAITGQLFDVIMMDPPWRIASSSPTRGVTIAYDTLKDKEIKALNIPCLQDVGFLFIWTVNSKLQFSLLLLEEWGYRYCDQICWIKQSNHKKIFKGNGYYLQHSRETCLIGVKGDPWKRANVNVKADSIFSVRRGQSQKPDEIYELIEALIPNGYYIEIFGRRNNLRSGWVTIGNEL